MALMTLHQYLAREERENSVPHELTTLLLSVADAAKNIRGKVSQGALAGVLGLAGTENVQGEDQKKLDVISNEIMCTANEPCGMLSGLASEEMTEVLRVSDDYAVGPYLILFDPLDGSSNIDIDAPIGTIFSVLPCPGGKKRDITEADFMQPGVNQLQLDTRSTARSLSSFSLWVTASPPLRLILRPVFSTSRKKTSASLLIRQNSPSTVPISVTG